MRVLQIEDEPWDSGIAHYAVTLCAELARRGHEVHFWGRVGSPPLEAAAGLGLPVLGLRRPWARLHSLRARVRASGIELINAHTGSGQALAAGLAAFLKVPVVRTRGDARPAAKNALARLLAARTRAFIAANSAIRAELAGAFPGAEVVTVFQGIRAPAAAPLPEAPVFGLLGRLDQVKGHETFLAAAALARARFPAARFLAVGQGSPRRRADLETRCRALGLGEACEFTGFVAEVWPWLGRCRAGVVASTGSEAVSRAALEWMAAGRPLIASRVGCLPDLVEEGVTGLLVPPGDASALAAAMARLLGAPDLAARMGAEGRRRFEERFSLGRFGEETERLYGKILGHLPS